MHFSGRGRPWAHSRGCVLGLALLLVLPASNTNPSASSHFCGGCVRPGDPSSRHGRLCESEDSWQQFQKIVPSRSRVRHTGNVKPGMTMMLDLDKCCLYGNDGNDLALSLQYMGKSQRQVLGLYRLIVNPSLRPAYERYKSAWKDVQVVVYTRRPNLLLYRSIVNGQILNLRYSAHWHDAGHQLHVPPEMKSADDVFAHYCGEELAEDEVHDIKKSLERLLCARDVIAEELGLTTPPSVVVTAKEKDIDLTARHLGLDAKNSVLYDDNVRLGRDSRVVLVEPFLSLSRERCEVVVRYMDEVLPPSDVDEDLIDYLQSGEPHERCLQLDAEGRPSWWASRFRPGENVQSWNLAPHLLPSESKAQTGMPAQKNGRTQTQARLAQHEAFLKQLSGAISSDDAACDRVPKTEPAVSGAELVGGESIVPEPAWETPSPEHKALLLFEKHQEASKGGMHTQEHEPQFLKRESEAVRPQHGDELWGHVERQSGAPLATSPVSSPASESEPGSPSPEHKALLLFEKHHAKLEARESARALARAFSLGRVVSKARQRFFQAKRATAAEEVFDV